MTFSFRDFWARRIRRILPALIFVTACTLVATYVFVFRLEQQVIGKQGLAALFSVANVYSLRNAGDYCGTAVEDSPLLHLGCLLAVSFGNQTPKNSNTEIFVVVGLSAIGLSYLRLETLNAGLVLAALGAGGARCWRRSVLH